MWMFWPLERAPGTGAGVMVLVPARERLPVTLIRSLVPFCKSMVKETFVRERGPVASVPIWLAPAGGIDEPGRTAALLSLTVPVLPPAPARTVPGALLRVPPPLLMPLRISVPALIVVLPG